MRNNKIVGGRYELLKEVGRGGSSRVYLASDLNLNKTWAVKEIRKKSFIEGFETHVSLLAEANVIKSLDHPALPRIVDIIEDDTYYYIVMDYVEGQTLQEVLKKKGPQGQEKVVFWAKELTHVLGYLHSQDPPIIYRDLKPGNVILQPNGHLKIIDFGTARTYKEGKTRDTSPLGTRGYAAPEQYAERDGLSGQSDARTDIYNLGITMYELLTGKFPSGAPYRYTPIKELVPDASEGLVNIIMKCIEFDPQNRFQSAEELMYALTHIEQMDTRYVAERRKKLRMAIIPIVAGLVMIFSGAGTYAADNFIKANSYEGLIAETTDTQQHIENLEKAIELMPENPQAYKLLLKEYSKSSDITEEDAGDIMKICSEGLSKIDPESEEYLEINYLLGESMLVYYKGTTDQSLRSKIMMARPYFDAVTKSGKTEYEKYDISRAYSNLASFYEDYVIDSGNSFVFDAGKSEYRNLIKECYEAADLLEKPQNKNASRLRLTTYAVILSIIDTQKAELAANVDKKKVDALLMKVRNGYSSVSVKNSELVSAREAGIEQCARIGKELEKAYRENEKETGGK